jgi:hypothetical protein
MAALATIIAILITWIVLSAYAWSWVMHKAALSEAEILDFWEVKASAESFGAGRAEMGADLRNANKTIQTNQTKQTTSHSKSPIKSGRVGQ